MNLKTKPAATTKEKGKRSAGDSDKSSRAIRETVESIAIAVILAFLFRGFEAEAFVIPTGSMAPTLMGRHVDVTCSECGYDYQAGASIENTEEDQGPRADLTRGRFEVAATTCPMCRYTMTLDRRDNPNERSFMGDRILVSKFAYDLGEPERWDVIVFKYPGDAKQNYIKRLVGLPGETVRIHHGDVFTRDENGQYVILRKPPDKVEAMLQPVADTEYESHTLAQAGWPSRWQDARAYSEQGAPENGWKAVSEGEGFLLESPSAELAWLRYRHLIPTGEEWKAIRDGQSLDSIAEPRGQLITDFYAYNGYNYEPMGYAGMAGFSTDTVYLGPLGPYLGQHWVGDLAVEANVVIGPAASKGPQELVLDLVEAGSHYSCRIDLATGKATLSISHATGGAGQFRDLDASGKASAVETVSGDCGVTADGKYRLRLANVDNQLHLWVDGDLVEFDGPTTFEPQSDRPMYSENDPGDLSPAGLGARNVSVTASRMRIFRDVYYVANDWRTDNGDNNDYQTSLGAERFHFTPDEIQEILADPEGWSSTPLYDLRRSVEFRLEEDQFFPLGDNSPQSKDARLWKEGGAGPDAYVHRDLLTGKALLIYWPHHWRRPIPLTPNFERMGLIR